VNYTKKRSIAGEVRHYREQKEEIERWEEMKQEKVGLGLGLGLRGVMEGGWWEADALGDVVPSRKDWSRISWSGSCFISTRRLRGVPPISRRPTQSSKD